MTMFEMLKTDDWGVVGKFLRDHYVENPAEKRRQTLAKRRDDFYEGGGDLELERLIDVAFKDPITKQLRTELVEWSKWNNLIFSTVRETSTVYSEPAARKVKTDNETFQQFLDVLAMDDAMREVNRRITLHEDVLVMYRVRDTPRGREPLLDVISPASFWAIHAPHDRTLLMGVIIDQRMPNATATDPAYRVWLDDETFTLDAACRVVTESYAPWPIKRIPGVLATARRPGTKCKLLADNPNADLVAAQSAGWLQDLLLVKESKSANRQTYMSGDVANVASGQSPDTERETVLPDGVNVQAIDRGMDLAQFRENSMYISDTVTANRGIPPSVRKRQDATSGAEMHLRTLPLRGIRREQIPVMRRTEMALFVVIALVNAHDLPEFAFDATEASVDFGEIQQPLTEQERDQVFETRRRLLLTDNLEEEMRRNPDVKTYEDAKNAVEDRAGRQELVVEMTKGAQALNGSSNSAVGENTAQQNGALGGAASAAKQAADARQLGDQAVAPAGEG